MFPSSICFLQYVFNMFPSICFLQYVSFLNMFPSICFHYVSFNMFSSVCFLPQYVSFNFFSICFLQYVFNILPFVSGMWSNVQSRRLNFVDVTSSCIYYIPPAAVCLCIPPAAVYLTSSCISLYSTSSCKSLQQLYIFCPLAWYESGVVARQPLPATRQVRAGPPGLVFKLLLSA